MISQLRKLGLFAGDADDVESMLWDAKQPKITAKGVNTSNQSQLTFHKFMSVLVDSHPLVVSVQGIRRDRTSMEMHSYLMPKKALSCLNFKTRNVNAVNTAPLY